MDRDKQIIGALFWHDKRLLEQVAFSLQVKPEDFADPLDRAVFDVVLRAYREGLPISPASLAAYTKGQFEAGFFDTYRDAGYEIGESEAFSMARLALQDSERRHMTRVLREAAEAVENGETMGEVRSGLSRKLQHTRGVITQDARPKSIRQRIDERRARGERTKIVPTRISWFDNLLDGGLTEKDIIAIGGRQKGRKTSTARMLLLQAALTADLQPNPRVSIAFCTFENDQESTYWDFVCMIAARILWDNRIYGEKLDLSTPERTVEPIEAWKLVTPRQIRKYYERGALHRWHPDIFSAVQRAIGIMDDLPIWIYDRTAENGGLKNLDSLKSVATMHKFNHVEDDQLYILCGDYAQLIPNEGDIFKDMVALSNWIIEAAQQYPATVMMLTQLNEQANFAKAKGEKMEWIGVKGGGDLTAAVHYFFTTDYDKKTPDELTLELAVSRKAGTDWQRFQIHPPSGLMTLALS